MNINKIIKNVKGEEMQKSYPTKEDIEALPKLEGGKSDITKLPRETVGNILLNVLASYPIAERKEIFYINECSSVILNAEDGKVEFKDKIKNFLVEVCYEMTFKKIAPKPDGSTVEGMYDPIMMYQVLEELGVKEE